MYAQHLDNTIGAYGRDLYTRGTGIADGLSELGVRICNDPGGTATDIGTGLVSMFVDDVVGTISAYPDVYGALSAGDFSGASERYWQGVKSAHRTAGSVVGFSGTVGSIRRGVFAAAKGGGLASRSAGAAESAFSVAERGGLHSGFLKNMRTQGPKQWNKTSRSLQKRIELHEGYLDNPLSHVPNWNSLPAHRQQWLTKHWNTELKNFAEQQDIVHTLLSQARAL